eukprot:TRINITY_DN363_c0_g2_i11.p1 TRINITY_DN363_c0_g2~~TRINITY_DN363_c0_g2_i11.p1  ORF type:complete len:871 (-),score=354.25 TRINITY_DN363_c0_g2_i11:199-2757(-)
MQASAEVQFAQRLAANEKKDRDKAVKKLKRWFESRSAGSKPFAEDELMRIWKGLYYCYWMSDKPLIQEELANSIATMIDCFGTNESALMFIKTFLLTMGREWFGIDRWRMDKFMMMVRRFIRQVFKFHKRKNWDEKLTENMSTIFEENLLLCSQSKTSLGLQMHISDLFLEELAKIGGEELPYSTIDIYLGPFYKVIAESRDIRLREHIRERVFNYLLRQSDCGIEWEVEKDVEELGNVEVIDEDALDEGVEVDDDGIGSEEEEGEGDEGVEAEQEQAKSDAQQQAEDPRAGKVDVEIPQLNVDYAKISDKLFELGSSDSIMKSNRKILYRLSKYFKDVESNIFPLGDANMQVEEVEKVNVKKEVNKLQKREDKIHEKNMKKKEEYRLWKKEQLKQEKLIAAQEKEASEENDVEEEIPDDQESDEEGGGEGMKRKLEEEAEESPDTKKAKLESKEKRKENEKKRKQEMKRKKRERLLAEKMKESEERRKADMLIDQELKVQETIATEKKSQVDVSAKKDKVELETSDEKTVVNEKKAESLEKDSSKAKKKKKKNNKEKDETPVVEKEALVSEVDLNKEKSKKKKKKSKKEADSQESPKKSDLKSNEEELSSSEKEVKKSAKKKKKSKDNDKAESPKKKANKENMSNGKLFDESNDWDTPLQPGEQEIVIPNKKYKGKVKLKPAAENPEENDSPKKSEPSPGFKDFEPPSIGTPTMKSHTALFLKKAMSKSVTPKKKLSQVEKLKTKVSSSESRVKRVNFALTKNTMQGMEDLVASIKSSPGIPHDPKKHPEKGLLKRSSMADADGGLNESISENLAASPMLNPVSLNTQLNSISKKGKKLIGKKRMKAMDFF